MDEWAAELDRGQLRRIWGNLRRRDPSPMFTRDELEAWLIEQSFQQKGSGWWCEYRVKCSRALGIAEISLDHKTPYSAIRCTTLDNLAVCCQKCNRTKGDVSAERFQGLVRMLDEWPREERSSVLKRLGQPPGQWARERKKPRATKSSKLEMELERKRAQTS